jgi:tRNA A37 threonylcarbamoyladenosine synthetase subunit TsaC/SUA5/YrdC
MTSTEVLTTTEINPVAPKLSLTATEKPIDIARDAQRVFEVLKKGGLAIIPGDVGYGLVAMDPKALERAFVTKQRQPHKRHAMLGSFALHKELHVLPEREANMVELLTRDIDIPLGVVAPCKMDHPLLQKLGPETLARSSVDGTLGMLVNGGKLQDELVRLSYGAGMPLMGSSANLSGKGTKWLVEHIEPEILAAADIIIDYGWRKYSLPRTSSTMIDFRTLEVLRFGCCYNMIKDVFERYYGITMPEDPGREVNFSGHRREAAKESPVRIST